MAEDRLDDAIAAVTRAVERIEAATRGVLDQAPAAVEADLPLPPQPRKPPPPAFTSPAVGFAARPTTAVGGVGADQAGDEPPVDPEWSDFEPPIDLPPPLPPLEPEATREAELTVEAELPTQPEAEVVPEPPERTPPLAASSETVHELVGQVIARTQELEEHLDAARGLRTDIIDLVSRIAAAADRDR